MADVDLMSALESSREAFLAALPPRPEVLPVWTCRCGWTSDQFQAPGGQPPGPVVDLTEHPHVVGTASGQRQCGSCFHAIPTGRPCVADFGGNGAHWLSYRYYHPVCAQLPEGETP